MKTILLHVHDDRGAEARLQAACDIARATGGHIRCVQLTAMPAMMMADAFGGAALAPSVMEELEAHDASVRLRLEARLAREDVSWDWRNWSSDPVPGLLFASRLTDLVILSLAQHMRQDVDDPLNLVEDVVLGGRTPVLAMPATARHVDPTGCAIVAWDGSAPAAAALTRATPLLKRAQAVHIVTVEEADKDRFPSTEAAEYLARYGVAVELHALPREGAAIETILAETAVRLGADWMVMGFYGHGRMREMIFGGVTRALLRDTRIPLLLAH